MPLQAEICTGEVIWTQRLLMHSGVPDDFPADGGYMSVVGTAASTEDIQLRQKLTQSAILLAQFIGIAGIECDGFIQFSMAF